MHSEFQASLEIHRETLPQQFFFVKSKQTHLGLGKPININPTKRLTDTEGMLRVGDSLPQGNVHLLVYTTANGQS